MHWKRYKALPEAHKKNEIYYIIGLDIGNDSSAIAFYNMAGNEPEAIDLSGGYGRPSIPTAMQYISEQREWVYGEYAVLNRGVGREVTLHALFERLGYSEYIDIDNRPVSVVTLLAMFIKELLSHVKNINPKAEIAGIVASVPSYFSDSARDEFIRAFKIAGYERELIALVPDRECVFSYHYHTQRTETSKPPFKYADGERVLLIDYGSRGVRGGVYHVKNNESASCREMISLSSLFDDTIGTQAIYEKVQELFDNFLSAHIHSPSASVTSAQERQLRDPLYAFVYQHKDMLFQKSIRLKPAKLYFNFVYPPFQQTVTAEMADQLSEPFMRQFNRFIRDVFKKNTYGREELSLMGIDTVLCVGGGFEMLWARESVAALFPQGRLKLFKNAKTVTAMGAAVAAAVLLDAAEGLPITIEDRHQLRSDIGIVSDSSARTKTKNNSASNTVKESYTRFIPLAECNRFWWQHHAPKTFIINAEVNGDVPIKIVSRTPDGDVRTLLQTELTGLPARPKGTTRLSAEVKFSSDSEATATITDCGFGELFPKVDYIKEISFQCE